MAWSYRPAVTQKRELLKRFMENRQEKFPSPPNNPPGNSLKGRWLFLVRRLTDLQVASVLRFLKPWICQISGNVLEIGCGNQPYRHLIPSSCVYKGLDWEKAKDNFQYSSGDTIYYDGDKFPFSDNTFDYVFHTEVLEHIYNVNKFLQECKRVLKPGGKLFFSVPFQARYHYIPYDYWRFTEAALEKILSAAGFSDIRIKPRGDDFTVAIYKNISLIYRLLYGNLFEKIVGCIFSPLIVVFLLTGHFSLKFCIGSQDDCLGYVVYSKG